MITVGKISFDFRMEDEKFVRALYGQWDSFFRQNVERVADDILTSFERQEEVIRIETLCLELGTLSEDEFYNDFSLRFSEKLQEVFADILRHREIYPVEIISLYQEGVMALLYFLRKGNLPAMIPGEYRDLHRLLDDILEKQGQEFVSGLKERGNEIMRRRLVWQFRDPELEQVVAVAEPSEAAFVQTYVRGLLMSRKKLKRPEITSGDYRNVVWEVVIAYIFYKGRSFFSRKEFVRQTISGLAAHYNLGYLYLLNLLTVVLKTVIPGWLRMSELFHILSEMREEGKGKKAGEYPDMEETDVEDADTEILKKLLSHTESCRRLLASLREEEIECLTVRILPQEGPFVVVYARTLEQEKEKGMLEGKAGNEFRLLKWEFLFMVLFHSPSSFFLRRQFVWAVISRIALHYNLDSLELLLFLFSDQENIPEEIREILQQLYEEHTWRIPLRIFRTTVYRGISDKEAVRLKFILRHPKTAHHFLQDMTESDISRLVHMVVPGESSFVISYASALEEEKEKGLLEGKAGGEFRLLKWEFIFAVILVDSGTTLHRFQFVREVLVQIAAHYNLELWCLLDYFYQAAIQEKQVFPEELRQVFLELQAELLPAQKESIIEEYIQRFSEKQSSAKAYFYTVFRKLKEGKEISLPVWEKAGDVFVRELLYAYQEEDVKSFIHRNRKTLWEFLTSSDRVTGLLWEVLQTREGLWNFLVKEYGEKLLLKACLNKGIPSSCGDSIIPSVWWEVVEQSDSDSMAALIKYAPHTVRNEFARASAGQMEWVIKGVCSDRLLLLLWVKYISVEVVSRVTKDLLRFQQYLSFPVDWKKNLYEWLFYTDENFRNITFEEIVNKITESWFKTWTVSQQRVFCRVLFTNSRQFDRCWLEIVKKDQWISPVFNEVKDIYSEAVRNGQKQQITDEKGKVCERKGSGINPPENSGLTRDVAVINEKKKEEMNTKNKEEKGENQFYISNAGLVLLAPYFPRLFTLLKWTCDTDFIDDSTRMRAIFAMQYLVYGKGEVAESDLVLNKLLTNYRSEEPLPLTLEFQGTEKELLDSLLQGVMSNWPVMKNTSVSGFQGSFLIREGILAETGDLWQLGVEEKSYDVLLDSLPWTLSPLKFPWMEKPLYTSWR